MTHATATYQPAVLVIEDEPSVQDALTRICHRLGYKASFASSVASGVDRALHTWPDALVLDVELPDGLGDDVLRQLSAAGCFSPVIVVTADSRSDTKERLFRLGARDYVTKPFELPDLEVRLTHIISHALDHHAAQRAGITLETRQFRVGYRGRTVRVQPQVWFLLHLLLSRIGFSVSPQEIYRIAWDYHADVRSTTVRVHVHRARCVLRQLGAPVRIRTDRSTGVTLECEALEPSCALYCAPTHCA